MNVETYLAGHCGHFVIQSISHAAYLWSAYTARWNISTILFSDGVYSLMEGWSTVTTMISPDEQWIILTATGAIKQSEYWLRMVPKWYQVWSVHLDR